jgi:hypothetical protein
MPGVTAATLRVTSPASVVTSATSHEAASTPAKTGDAFQARNVAPVTHPRVIEMAAS